jgi:hypothetical protein
MVVSTEQQPSHSNQLIPSESRAGSAAACNTTRHTVRCSLRSLCRQHYATKHAAPRVRVREVEPRMGTSRVDSGAAHTVWLGCRGANTSDILRFAECCAVQGSTLQTEGTQYKSANEVCAAAARKTHTVHQLRGVGIGVMREQFFDVCVRRHRLLHLFATRRGAGRRLCAVGRRAQRLSGRQRTATKTTRDASLQQTKGSKGDDEAVGAYSLSVDGNSCLSTPSSSPSPTSPGTNGERHQRHSKEIGVKGGGDTCLPLGPVRREEQASGCGGWWETLTPADCYSHSKGCAVCSGDCAQSKRRATNQTRRNLPVLKALRMTYTFGSSKGAGANNAQFKDGS